MAEAEKIEVLNITSPTHVTRVDRAKYMAMRQALLAVLPDAAPGWLAEAKRARPNAALRSVLGGLLPQRLADVLADRLEVGELHAARDAALAGAERQLADWRFRPNGTEGFAKAEVTVGGIATDGLSQRTMEAKRLPGLYCIGEAVDVTGWLGGYNFQWAWASGFAAGEAIAERAGG